MSDEPRAGQAEPSGEVIAAAADIEEIHPVNSPATETELEAPQVVEDVPSASAWPVTQAVLDPARDEPQEDTPADEVSEPAPQEAAQTTQGVAPDASPPDYERLFQQSLQINAQLVAQIQQAQSGQYGTTTGQSAANVPTQAVPGPALFAHQNTSAPLMPPEPPDPIERVAEENGTTVADPLVQRIHRQSQEVYQLRLAQFQAAQQQQQMLNPVIADYQQRLQAQREYGSFNHWLNTECPSGDRPKSQPEADAMYVSFRSIIDRNGMGYTPFGVLLTLHKANSAPTQRDVQQARKEGYEQSLKKKGQLSAANAASGRPSTRSVEQPPARTFREQYLRDNPHLRKKHG